MIRFLLATMLVAFACQPAQDPKPRPAPGASTTQEPGKPESGKPEPGKPVDPKAQALIDELKKQLQQEGIVYDAAAGTVSVKAVVNQPQDPIEYLLIHRKGKRHEAMFVTKAKPSVLNAALLLLGLKAGTNASYKEKDPAPTLEEVQNGADPVVVTPPQGEPFWMTVRWKNGEDTATEKASIVEHCVEDLILDRSTGLPIAECAWVYLGGRLAQLYRDEPEVFIADFEGNLVSTCYMAPENHLGTIVHASARDDENWWMTNLMPAPDTEVEFVFHARMPKLHQERQKRLAEAKAKPPAEVRQAPAAGEGEPPR